MIDIIIPIYNVGNLLYRCIDSLLNQIDKTGYKIYLIDDGSSDISADICNEYASKYNNIFVFHKKNGGGVEARWYGIKHSSSEYIVFIDADDFVEKDYIINLKKAITHVADYYILNNKRNYIIKNGYYIEKDFLLNGYITVEQTYEWMLNSKINAVWDKIYVRDVIEKNNINFKVNIMHGDDLYINMLYLKNVNKVYCQDTSSYVHIMDSPTSVCNNDTSIKRLYDIKKLYDNIITLIPKNLCNINVNALKKSLLMAYFVAVGLISRKKENFYKLDRFFLDENLDKISINLTMSFKEKIFFYLLINKKYRLMGMIQKIYNIKLYKYLLDKRYEKREKLIKKRRNK
ncbi:glycosyltransferase family 2 protein [Megamonas funiformis]|mgnify:CR=1 FL=1|jgi:glycosyltransferase involved in cell wall biosynthesis|uniref:glycosyltransferase family 2 protein n=1 Tax=Megamonas funiformis TaxID=437897 RepID=UPI00241CCDA6|nr:glycosyltransferase family 2 protein [Megamonas funiformis]